MVGATAGSQKRDRPAPVIADSFPVAPYPAHNRATLRAMSPEIHQVTRNEFLESVYENSERFMDSIARYDVYIVKEFYPRGLITGFMDMISAFRAGEDPSWHPCLDGVPDYHRINDEYPGSWVKARMHSFYLHRFNERGAVFDDFREVFELKNFLAGEPSDSYLNTVPSDEVISRVVSHQYPRGGGYLAEHVDPTSRFAKLQTIIQASTLGKDFESGGLYFRTDDRADPIWVDQYSEPGDLMVLSPDVRHGVGPVDPEAELDWSDEGGRWMILPIIIRSDYNMDPDTKPKAVT